ncbi:MAG: ParA family protein [Xanthomonadaceae bacterium]|jgi:chromosome partitioning protein|nr:ParA family protein [Xanthomonadaceae bacterium]
MKTILVAGSKGGIGKTTISTHLAAYFALAGKRTILADADPQGSALNWAERRNKFGASVPAFDASRKRAWPERVPPNADYVVIDAPAGAMAEDMERFIDGADCIIVPVLPSALDIEAIVRFLNSLATMPRIHKRKLPVGLVLNRTKPWTHASQQALAMLRSWPYPVVAQLRDTQAYVVMVGLGRSLFDYQSAAVREHQADWEPLFDWITKAKD